MKQHAISGAKWTTASTVLSTSFQMIQMLVLARLLPPETFGLLAILMLVVGFADLQTQLGLNQVIVQEKTLSAVQSSSLYWFSLLAAVAMYITCNLVYLLGEGWLFDPALANLLPVITLAFIINASGGQFGAYLQKNLNFRAVALAEVFGALSGTVIAISLVMCDYGIWALVLGFLTRCSVLSGTLFVFAFRQGSRIKAVFHFASIRAQLKFACHLLGGNLLNFTSSRTDQLIVGGLLGQQALGYYAMAFNVVIQPVLRLTPIISRVALPLLARIKDSATDLGNGYRQTLTIQAVINTPVFLGLAVVSPQLIPTLLGEQWLESASIVQWLCLFAFCYCITLNGISFLIAAGQSAKVLQWQLIVALCTPFAVLTGAIMAGSPGAAAALGWLHLGLLPLWYLIMVRPLVSLSAKAFARPFIGPLLCGLVMVALVMLIQRLSDQLALSPLLALGLQIIAGALCYAACQLWVWYRRKGLAC
ncbi:MOP flippase family protein [Shewanella sp. FJAT-52076]|uniref:MOP flippase family protein n=1 Tax=Shewanella sp. FJAT-52076 TaxID=2864202 RepID=UPI001C657835|nr:MOP flippase family protein [Shewanella sp. FJAT-52076]QYJ74033.1 MOP flippase family protein [Shewanella sp. FJAT-52076]